ncbi:hypothetical protein ILUMI_13730 [Ignelater luminosus]|uniref:Reverse transcriptase Ty1/copia-type domain-containing protein n=1 Tax=Ignelater luminosus TaxID=2038154 RepID=A0A8K0CRU5_IGNLU|nr:hypothetical protein ILUMI_13730 [Ignelater luminosus]
MKVHQMDVVSAFLNSDIKKKVYIEFKIANKVGPLQRSIYGLKRSPRCWNEELHKTLQANAFDRSKHDYCLYIKSAVNFKIYILVFVDDLIVVGTDLSCVNATKKFLSEKFKMKDPGIISNYLGIAVNYNEEDGIMSLNQTYYLKKILQTHGMAECKLANTPMDQNFPYYELQNIEENLKPEDKILLEKKCRQVIGSLMYAVTGTRPDLCSAVIILSRYQNCVSTKLWIALKHVLRYVKGTLDLSRVYRRSPEASPICGFVDANWAGDTKGRKSTSGFTFKVMGNCVTWSSKKQYSVSLSSAESEFVALSLACSDACWLRNIVKDLQVVTVSKIELFEDNQAVIKASKNPEYHSKMKHIDIHHDFVREKIESGEIDVKYISAEDQEADIFTKPLPKVKFNIFVEKLGLTKL